MTVGMEDLWEELDTRLRWRTGLCRILTRGRHWLGKSWPVKIRSLEGLSEEEWHSDKGFQEIGRFRQCRICYFCRSEPA